MYKMHGATIKKAKYGLADVPHYTVNFVLTTMRTSNLTMMLLNLSHPTSHLLCAPKSSEIHNCFN